MNNKKKLIFLSATRAEYGKFKPLIKAASEKKSEYEVHLFVTGMHLLEKYGSTAHEILREFSHVYLYNNQAVASHMDTVLSNTVYGFGYYVRDIKPDLIVVHGDRVEALAGSIVGSLNNVLVAHIEGGEISGTIDELIRHSVTKLSHIHFVANEQMKKRLIQMGEQQDNIHIIGSPDIDIMSSGNLPGIGDVLSHYNITFSKYAILMYHPVTTDIGKLGRNTREVVDAVIESDLNYIVVSPNNDHGSDIIFKEYERFKGLQKIKSFPSIRFENFLVLLKHCKFIIGNSSAGIREAPIYAVPTINIGSRQLNRFKHTSIFNVDEKKELISNCIKKVINNPSKYSQSCFFGNGQSVNKFMKVLEKKNVWDVNIQKQFIDLHTIN